jgi:hypothetical protein
MGEPNILCTTRMRRWLPPESNLFKVVHGIRTATWDHPRKHFLRWRSPSCVLIELRKSISNPLPRVNVSLKERISQLLAAPIKPVLWWLVLYNDKHRPFASLDIITHDWGALP